MLFNLLTRLKKRLTCTLIYLFFWLFPKKNNIWLFGAWFGKRYADNPRYLFEYIRTHHPNINAYWVTKNKKLKEELSAQGIPAYLNSDPFFIITKLIRAKVFVFSHHLEDITYAIQLPNIVSVQLWHGTPIKKIFRDDTKNNPFFLDKITQDFKLWLIQKYSYIPIPSMQVAQYFRSAYRDLCTDFPPIGYPRVSYLLDNIAAPRKDANRHILYAPTFRLYQNEQRNLYGFMLSENFLAQLDNKLSKYKLALDIRLHPQSYAQLKEEFSKIHYNSIKLVDSNDDIYQSLAQYDLLITDVSSLLFDFAVLNRYIVVLGDTLDKYKKMSRELYFDPSTLPDIVYCNTQEQLNEFLDFFIKLDSTEHQNTELNQRFNQFQPNAAQKNFEYIQGLLDAQK